MIILVGAQKGGCGKSTVSLNLAIALAVREFDVCLVDADRQETGMRCAQIRSGLDLPQFNIVCQYEKIHPTLNDLNKRYQYVIVDVAGRDSLELRSGLVAADLLVAPFRPSVADLETLAHLNEVVEHAKVVNEKLICKGLLSMCPTNPIIKERMIAEHVFSDYPNFKLFETAIHDRKVYRDCLGEGKGVVESDNAKAKLEMNNLVEEILCHQ